MFKDKKDCIALYGGSFDPIHFGHKSVIDESLKVLNIDKVIVVPTYLNPFKKEFFLSPKIRLKIIKNALRSKSKVVVDDFEIRQKKPTPTFNTLQYLQKIYNVKYIIIGADNLTNIDKWYNFSYLNQEIIWAVAKRKGYSLDTSKLNRFIILDVDANISSTKIREEGYKFIMDIDSRVDRIVNLLDEKKGEEIEVFNLDDIEYIAKRVILVNSLAGKHSFALVDYLKEKLKPLGEEFLHIDDTEDWIVVDMGDILVHIMSPIYRQKYSLEEFLTEISIKKDNEL